MSTIKKVTTNYNFRIPVFDAPGWGREVERNFEIIDSIMFLLSNFGNVKGLWLNGTAYTSGERVIDPSDGKLFQAQEDHTSAASGTFAQDRASHPTYWEPTTNVVQNRGEWVTGTTYNVNDFIVYDHKYGVAVVGYTSGVSYDADVLAGNIVTLVDLTDDYNDVTNAALYISTMETVINALYNIRTDITTVGAIDTDVASVAALASDVTTVASNTSNISTTATNITDVQEVASISGAVTNVAGISSDVTNVSGISVDVVAVAAAIPDIQAAVALVETALDAADRAEGFSSMLSADKVKFKTVALLVADTLMSYIAGPGLIEVGAGDVIEAQGFRYEVAVSGASDYHVETAASVKLRVLPLPDGTIDVRQFGAGDGVQTARIQAALDAAAALGVRTVLANDRQYLTDEVTVPSDVEFRFDLKMATGATPGSPRNCVRPHPRSRLIGKIEGTNVTNVEVVERGIYPAVDGCHDVYLDVEITKTTVGVQANPLDLNDPPRRWSGRIVARDIAGYVGGSNGYGLNGALCDSRLHLIGVNVPRHTLYLAAAACDNEITVHDDGGRAIPIDIAAFTGQPGCYRNKITAFVRAHTGDYGAGILACGGILNGGVHDNEINIYISNSAPLYAAFRAIAYSASVYPTNNRIRVHFDGDITGAGVVDINSGVGNRVSVRGRATAAAATTGIVRVGRNDGITPAVPGPFAVSVDDVDFNCISGFTNAVLVAADYAQTDLGGGVIKARGYSGNAVNYSTFGDAVIGWIFENVLTVTTASIAVGASGDAVFNYTYPLPLRRFEFYSVFHGGAEGDKLPDHAIVARSGTGMTVRVRNNRAIAGAMVVNAMVRGF